MDTSAKKVDKKPNEPHLYVLAFPETGKVLLFKNKNYRVSVSIDLKSSQIHSLLPVYSTQARVQTSFEQAI